MPIFKIQSTSDHSPTWKLRFVLSLKFLLTVFPLLLLLLFLFLFTDCFEFILSDFPNDSMSATVELYMFSSCSTVMVKTE